MGYISGVIIWVSGSRLRGFGFWAEGLGVWGL